MPGSWSLTYCSPAARAADAGCGRSAGAARRATIPARFRTRVRPVRVQARCHGALPADPDPHVRQVEGRAAVEMAVTIAVSTPIRRVPIARVAVAVGRVVRVVVRRGRVVVGVVYRGGIVTVVRRHYDGRPVGPGVAASPEVRAGGAAMSGLDGGRQGQS